MPSLPERVALLCAALLSSEFATACRSERQDSSPVARGPTATAPSDVRDAPSLNPAPSGTDCSSDWGSPDRRLTRFELAYAVEDAFGVDASSLHDLPPPLAGIGEVPDILVGRLLDRSEASFLRPYRARVAVLAREIGRRRARECAGRADVPACVVERLREPAERLWRRPLDAPSRERLVAIAAGGGRRHGGAVDAAGGMFAAAVTHLLDSERFYVLSNEPPPAASGAESRQVERRRLASRLALVLWSSVPDQHLLRSAESGALDEVPRLAVEIERMMAHAHFRRFSREFLRQWLRLDRAPTFRPSLEARTLIENRKLFEDSLEEASRFLRRHIEARRPVEELLVGGPSAAASGGPASLLTSGAVLGALSTRIRGGGDENWLGRGLVVQAAFLCRTFPLAAIYPLRLWQDHPLLDPHVVATSSRPGERVLLAMRTKDKPCRECHRQLETIGAALWMFDGLGRRGLRPRPATMTATATASPGVAVAGQPVDGPDELGRWILGSGRFPSCVAQKLWTYVLGRAVLPAKRRADRCLVRALTDAPTASGGLGEWLARSLSSPAFAGQGTQVVRDKPIPAASSDGYLERLAPVDVTPVRCQGFNPGAFLVENCGSSACHGAGTSSALFAVSDPAQAATLLRAGLPEPDGYCGDEPGYVNTKNPGASLVVRKLTAGADVCGGPMPITGGPRTLDPVDHACFVRWIEAVARGGS